MANYRTYKYTKNGNTYYVCVAHLGYKEDGNRLRIQTHGKNKAVAEAAMKLKLTNYNGRKINLSDPKILLNDWVDSYWQGTPGKKLKETTKDLYNTLYKTHIKPYFESYMLRPISNERIQKFITHLHSDTGLSPASVRQVWNVLRMPLKRAFNKGILEYDVTEDIDLPPMTQKKVASLSEEELTNLLQALDDKKYSFYKFAIVLLLYTGLRRGELLALRWEDINFETRSLLVKSNLVRTKTGIKALDPKTKASTRMVIFPSEICDMLKERRNLYPDDIYVVRQQHHDKPVAPNNFSRYFRSVCDKAGIKDQGLHRLRHTFTSMSYAAGIDSRITQNQLGHSSLRMTVGVYTHIQQAMMQTASEKLYQQLSTIMTKQKKD